MRKNYFRKLLILLLIIMSIVIQSNSKGGRQQFIQRKGKNLVIGNRQVKLRGICFGNCVGAIKAFPYTHHSEIDFQRLKKMGVNVIRFYMYYGTFEDDDNPYEYKKLGWKWIDKNIAWAKKYGIYLILNMHIPQGGFQSLGKGDALWGNRENQKRFVALWKAIANRYKNETIIAGYDLLNEPVVTKSVKQWKTLAQETIDEIRSVDKNHLIVIEKLLYAKNNWATFADADYTQFLVNDNNVMYQFHFYLPLEYTHQLTSWTPFGEGGRYPDETIIQVPEDALWKETGGPLKKVPAGDSKWTLYEGKIYKAKNTRANIGYPVFVSRYNSGTIYFDAFEIKEYNEKKKYVRTVMNINLKNSNGWQKWSSDGNGDFDYTNFSGYKDSYSLTISETTGDANYTGKCHQFRARPGYYYQINGWMRGKNINTKAECFMRIDYYKSQLNKPLHKRNKKYLEANIKELVKFGKKHNVPMYCGEFGLYKECFQNNKGGLRWVADTLEILDKYGVHYTYHAYHEKYFGIYNNGSYYRTTENSSNKPLIKLLTEHIKSIP